MCHSWKFIIGLLLVSGFVVGCQGKSPPPATASSAHDDHDGHHADDGDHNAQKEKVDDAKEAKISAVLSKLSPDDRKLAEAQKFCAVMSKERLGGMGAPIKLDIKGRPVFVCCSGCKQKALKNPDETLEKVAAMNANNETTQP